MKRFSFMKRLVTILLIIMIILTLNYLTEYMKFYFKKLTEVSNYFDLSNKYEGLELEFISKDNEENILRIRNNSSSQIVYGRYYGLEKYTENKWFKVPFKEGYGDFTSEALELQPNNVFEQEISMNHLDYFLKVGKYRIVKILQLEDKNIILAVEFSVDKKGETQEILK